METLVERTHTHTHSLKHTHTNVHTSPTSPSGQRGCSTMLAAICYPFVPPPWPYRHRGLLTVTQPTSHTFACDLVWSQLGPASTIHTAHTRSGPGTVKRRPAHDRVLLLYILFYFFALCRGPLTRRLGNLPTLLTASPTLAHTKPDNPVISSDEHSGAPSNTVLEQDAYSKTCFLWKKRQRCRLRSCRF